MCKHYLQKSNYIIAQYISIKQIKKRSSINMCLSDSKVSSRQSKEHFKRIYNERIQYVQGKQLSQFIICMLEYMQRILEQKVGIAVTQEKSFLSCLPCCGYQIKYRNVRKEFQKAFENSKSEEQLQYYRKFVNALIQKKIPKLYAQTSNLDENILEGNQDQSSFNVEVKGSLTWSDGYTMTILPQKLCLLLKSPDQKQTLVNLKNYILRQSNSVKQNSYVLHGIVPIQPITLRFAVPSGQKLSALSIIKKIKKISDQALEANVNNWKKPVQHIKNSRLNQTSQKVKQNIFKNQIEQEDKTKKKQAAPQVKKSDQINDPIMNKLKGKAKLGIVKKAQQYQESVQDAQSKQGRLSSVNDLGFPNQKEKQVKSANIALEEVKQQDDLFAKIIGVQKSNQNQSISQAFKKKPKSPMSAYENQQMQTIPKRKPTLVQIPQNYAMRPQDTRSESGLKQSAKDVPKSTQSLKQYEMEPIDSGKSLINELEEVIIQEEDQFGNASQLSHSQQLSFKTIGEPGAF